MWQITRGKSRRLALPSGVTITRPICLSTDSNGWSTKISSLYNQQLDHD